MAASFIRSLTQLWVTWKPARVLAVGKPAVALLSGQANPTRADPEEVMALETGRSYDLAVVAGALEELPPEQGAACLARLRDLLARRLVVIVPAGHPYWDRDTLLGFGLEYRGRWRHEDHDLDLYVFDIEHYKTTPDWLNADHWAHPELFGKFWW